VRKHVPPGKGAFLVTYVPLEIGGLRADRRSFPGDFRLGGHAKPIADRADGVNDRVERSGGDADGSAGHEEALALGEDDLGSVARPQRSRADGAGGFADHAASRRESLASRRESLASRRESLPCHRENLASRRGAPGKLPGRRGVGGRR
jgi:hypothetical protein